MAEMRLLRSIVARVRDWYFRAVGRPIAEVTFMPMLHQGQGILRDVTPGGVRVYSLCGGCGARLECSATLCEECARGPHTSTF